MCVAKEYKQKPIFWGENEMSEYLVTSMMLFVANMVIYLLYIPIDKKMFRELEIYWGGSIPKNKYRHIYGIALSGIACMIPYVRVGFVLLSILIVVLLTIKPIRRLVVSGFVTHQEELAFRRYMGIRS